MAISFNRMCDQLAARDAELRESNQRLKTVLEGMVEGVISLDARQRIVLANAAAGRLMGFLPEDAVGRPLLEVVRNHVLHDALDESQRENRALQKLEIQIVDETTRAVSVYSTLLPQSHVTRFILVLQDVTEIRRLESMRQEFVANVSHELKTPLSAIKAYAETLSNGAINDNTNNIRFVNSIEEQAERLHQLILDLLSIARIESGQQVFDIRNIPVAPIVEACFAEHQAVADSKRIQFQFQGTPQDLSVQAEEEGMRQMLNNLIRNAINYTPDEGTVEVRWRLAKDRAVIEVVDTGIGISPEHHARLFERFYRVDKARSRELGGTGLGLSIVKHLAQSFGGNVEVDSALGEGTTFRVWMIAAEKD